METLKTVLASYMDALFWQAEGAMVVDEAQQLYLTMLIPQPNYPLSAQAQMARIDGDFIVIHADYTNRPLVQELVTAGIPRQQIVCAYLGETSPKKGEHNP